MFAQRTNWNLKPNRLSEALEQHRARGVPLLDLTQSNPTKCEFDFDGPIILNALASLAALEYRPDPKGMETARAAVAEYYAALGATVAPENILLTTSTSEAYSFAFRLLCDPGDELLVPEPSYPLLEMLAGIQDVKLVKYPLAYDHGWQIDFPALERAVTARTRAVIVVHPNNPTGNYCKPREAEALNKICAARGLALVADEVFYDFALEAEKPATFAAHEEALTLAMSGLSKIAGLPQMKLSWLVVGGPAELRQQALARLEVISDAYLSLNVPVQLATREFLETRHTFQEQLMARVRENIAALDRQLKGSKACSRVKVEGGWNAVLRVPATRSDEELAIELLTTKGVYVHPGHFYDFPGEGYLVVSLIVPDEEFAEGIRRLLEMF